MHARAPPANLGALLSTFASAISHHPGGTLLAGQYATPQICIRD